MVDRTRELERALGSSDKIVAGNERETVVIQRRCLRAARDLSAGTVLTREMIDVLRPAPADAVFPFEIDRVLGLRLLADLEEGEHLRWPLLGRREADPVFMRILYFTKAYTVHDARFLRELAASPHEIWFLPYFQAGGDDWRLPDRVQSRELAPPRAPADGSLDGAVASMAAFEEILSSIRPDVLHAGPIQPCGFMAALSGFHPLLSCRGDSTS